MKRWEMGELISKLLGLIFVYWLFSLGWMLVGIFPRMGMGLYYYPGMISLSLWGFLAVAAFFCLRYSHIVGRWLYREEPEETLLRNVNFFQAQDFAFSVLGLYFAVSAIVKLAQTASSLMLLMEQWSGSPQVASSRSTMMTHFWTSAISNVLELLLGLWIFFKANRVSAWWRHARGWEEKPSDGNPPSDR